jgi:hypothetical protein
LVGEFARSTRAVQKPDVLMRQSSRRASSGAPAIE